MLFKYQVESDYRKLLNLTSPEAEIATFQFETYRQNIWLNENNCVSRTGYKRSIIWIFMVKPADYFNLKEQVKSF